MISLVGNESDMSLLTFPNSGNTYYFRSRIPIDLIEHFGGLSEFRVSLKCAIKSRSIRTSKILDKIVSKIFEEIREGMKSLDINDIKEILRIEIRKQILHAHRVREGTNRWDEDGINRSLESIQLKESNLKETLKSDSKSYKEEVESKLEGILDSLDIDVQKNSLEFQKLRNNFIDLYLLRHDWMRELVNQTGKSDDDFRRNAQEKVGMSLFPELQETSFEEIRENFKKTVFEKNSSVSDVGSLTTNSNIFFERKKIEGKKIKEIESDKRILEEFIEIVGDIDFSSVTKKEVSRYIDVQTKLPPNRKKSPKYRDLSINEVVDKNLSQKETQTPQNINKRLSKLTVFGNWGVRQGLLINNPFSGMKFSVKKQPNKREPFTKEELRKILKPETYHSWSINFTHPFRKQRVSNQMPYYWVFLLGIFSGMRTNEMCQIRVIDIKKVDKIWFMFVEDSEETKVKTENAIRKVPVHPQLIELGFIDYVGTLKKQKKGRVFWELTEDRDGFASHLSRHYNQRVLPNLGVWKKYTKVLYCTRHTFINKLYTERVDENVIKVLVGHEKGFTMKQYGGEPFTPERLLEEISKVNYSGINWKKLKI